ncbi:anaerobic ribonucleoside-triphosphate reductase activating protein [Bacillus swezeyi]|uniref:Anaerobic ribonucleoside-triphosphate reductase-activating protein n=2 Tax=Bacillus swezeyi TaxID=1925020 RepID=A0A5M8RQP6_9BACI|nr:anaerobic ribonucleoside-triphosphate reductase activating protein [Bacillus swezeyi]KAA6474944.1 anaerobic ribonucleoside-triphosphate reductase activating protein [Bacillus swezeyi]TYS37390.1 anaerobic ribonucleoside-triphosphate reductase activating protein [Bacillus swezeyi]
MEFCQKARRKGQSEAPMKVMNIIHDSIVDGEGLRTVVFLAGCPHMCEGCHNKQSWNINNGFDMSVDEVFEEIMKNPLTNVTYSGGEPLLHASELIELSEKIRKHSEKDIWLYSGYTYEQILSNEKHSALLAYCDVLVDGPFEIKNRDLTLLYRGSSNQRIIELT